MNIHEQIIAFLDGELRDESQVAELLHVLAVAPEKQRLLIDQVKIRRSYATFGGGLATPLAADAAILQGLHAIDTSFPSAPPPPLPAQSAPGPASSAIRFFRYHPALMGSVAAFLITVGGVIGYILGEGGGRGPATGGLELRSGTVVSSSAISGPAAPSVSQAPALSGTTSSSVQAPTPLSAPANDRASSSGLIVALRDSLAALRSRYASLAAGIGRSRDDAFTDHRMAARTVVADSMAHRSDEPQLVLANAASATQISVVTPRAARSIDSSNPLAAQAMGSPAQMLAHSVTSADLAVADRVWQVGMRSNFRLSFPRVYGVEPQVNALTDREILLSRRFEAGGVGLQMPMRMGVAVGGTQFSESFHTNTGGQPVDTIIEQTPSFIYARGFIAPEIISSENFGASLELGGGGTTIGPFATLGFGLEYRALDRISVDAGVSSWLLWTRLQQQSIMSTNLNAHIGAAMWFSFDEIFK